MAWSIRLTTDRPISVDDADAIVTSLPESFHHWMGGISREKWGWSAATDINLPEGTTWRISGSYYTSGDIARPMAIALAMRLQLHGYTVTVGEMTG